MTFGEFVVECCGEYESGKFREYKKYCQTNINLKQIPVQIRTDINNKKGLGRSRGRKPTINVTTSPSPVNLLDQCFVGRRATHRKS
jgi:hypothetical protein